MRKRQISPTLPSNPPSGQAWLDLNRTALVEVTSEENDYPIESALLKAESTGWRAANPGPQTIRLVFDEPQKLRRIRLAFEDSENTRTQEFVLRWSDTGRSFREIVRQQWNFSPPDSAREIEDYAVELSEVMVLELIIVPDKSGGAARASLASLRLA
jgi:F5/8 type C domain